MYKYSPISKIYIKNFRNIEEAIIDFEDSPIISLIGENEAGKTSVVKAFSVCALHSTPRDQKDYIRDGTGGFGVAIELKDGTRVTRMKTTSLNSYNVKRPDGTEWDTNKIDSGLPQAVQDIMGLIEESETKEYLQVRTYEDQLLFVTTQASTNYKVMYDALKVDQLTKAIKLGSKEVNSLKSEIDTNDNGMATLTSNLRGIRTYDITPLLNIKTRLAKESSEVEKLSRAHELLLGIEARKIQIGAMAKLFSENVTSVNEGEAAKIENISRLIYNIEVISNELTHISSIDTAEDINLAEHLKIENVSKLVDNIVSIKTKLGSTLHITEADEVNEVQLIKMVNASNLIDSLETQRKYLAIIEPTGAGLVEQSDFDVVLRAEQIISKAEQNKVYKETEKQIDEYCNGVTAYLKSIGAAVEMCPKCGESIVIDTEKYA